MYLGSTSDLVYHPLNGLLPLKPSHWSMKITSVLVLVLFSKAPLALMVLSVCKGLNGSGLIFILCSNVMVQNSLRGFHIIWG